MKMVRTGLFILALVTVSVVAGRYSAVWGQSDPWFAAPFKKGLGLVQTSCGALSLTAGTYHQVVISTGGAIC